MLAHINFITKEDVKQLSRNGLKDLIEKNKKNGYFQVFQIKQLTRKDSDDQINSAKFRCTISDGFAKSTVILGNEAAKAAKQKNLKDYGIIQVNDCLNYENESKQSIIIITEIDVIHSQAAKLIGNPLEWTKFRQNEYKNPVGDREINQTIFEIQQPEPVPVPNQNSFSHSQNDLESIVSQKPIFEAIDPNSNSNTRPISIHFRNELVFDSSGMDKDLNDCNSQQSLLSLGKKSANETNRNNGFRNANVMMEFESLPNAGKENPISKPVVSEDTEKKNTDPPLIVKNLPKVSAKDCTPIKQLVPGISTKVKLKGKVLKKSVLRKFERNRVENRVFTIELVDAEGGMIQGSFFGDVAKTNYPRILENELPSNFGKSCLCVYSIKNDYQVAFDKSTYVQEVEDDDHINGHNFEFVPITQIQEAEINKIVDVLGLIKRIDPCRDVTIIKSGGLTTRRTIEIYDDSLNTVEITLWGEEAQNFSATENELVVGKALRVSEFLNRKNLTANLISQLFYGETLPHTTEIDQLIEWKKKNEFKFYKPIQNSRSNEYGTSEYLTIEQVEQDCVNFQDEKKFFDVKGYVSYINSDNLYYFACTNEKCMKKASGDNKTGWICYSCNVPIDKPAVRYLLRGRIEDETGSIWANLFHKEGEIILNENAEEIKKWKESGLSGRISELIQQASSHEWKFRLMAKRNNIASENRITYQVVKCNSIDSRSESKHLVDILKQYDGRE